MVLYNKLDQKTWASQDFTDSATYDLSGTIYDENTFTTTRDISGFTGTFRLLDAQGRRVFSTTSGLTLNSDGTWLLKLGTNNRIYPVGSHKVRLTLEVSGTRVTCVGVNGSDELFIEND